MPRSQSNRRRNAEGRGATTYVTGTDTKVTYDSRHARDDKPWKDARGNRYAGTETESRVS